MKYPRVILFSIIAQRVQVIETPDLITIIVCSKEFWEALNGIIL